MEPGYVRDEENEDILMQNIFEHRDKDDAVEKALVPV